jgi:hypothetical protein
MSNGVTYGPITVNIENPPANGAPLMATVRIRTQPPNTAYSVCCVLVQPSGGALPPAVAAPAGGGAAGEYWEASVGGTVGVPYTVVAIAVRTDGTGAVLDSGSDARVHCPRM